MQSSRKKQFNRDALNMNNNSISFGNDAIAIISTLAEPAYRRAWFAMGY